MHELRLDLRAPLVARLATSAAQPLPATEPAGWGVGDDEGPAFGFGAELEDEDLDDLDDDLDEDMGIDFRIPIGRRAISRVRRERQVYDDPKERREAAQFHREMMRKFREAVRQRARERGISREAAQEQLFAEMRAAATAAPAKPPGIEGDGLSEADQLAYGVDGDGFYEVGAYPLAFRMAEAYGAPIVKQIAAWFAQRVQAIRQRKAYVKAEAKRRGVHPRTIRRELRKQRRAARRERRSQRLQRPGAPAPTSPPPSPATQPASPTTAGAFRPPGEAMGIFRRRRPRGWRRERRRGRRAERRGRRGGARSWVVQTPRGLARCTLIRGDDGGVYAVDENGSYVQVVGMDDDVADEFEGAYDDDGYEGDDDGYEGDDVMDAEDIVGDDEDADDDILGGVEQDIAMADQAELSGQDEIMGASAVRLKRKIDRINARIDKVEDKPLRQPFIRLKERKRKKRISRLRRKRARLQEKLDGLERKSTAAAAAIAGVAMGIGAATALGVPIASRQGQIERGQVDTRLYDPAYAHQVRVQQANTGARATYTAPPGSGRLAELPMFAVGSTNPRNALTVPAALITPATRLTTEDLPYVLVKLLGFFASTSGTAADNNAIGLVQNLQIRGGTNLFLHENPQAADSYNTTHDRMTGLRDYPNIRSPNTGSVSVLASGDLDDVVVITTSLIVDVLEDDTYGPGLATPTGG